MKSVFTLEYEAFLQTIIAVRKSAGLTQQQLAVRLEKPQSFVSKYERGERRLDVVEFLSVIRVMGSDPYEVLRRVEEQTDLLGPEQA